MKCFNQNVTFEKKWMEKGFWELILNFNLPAPAHNLCIIGRFRLKYDKTFTFGYLTQNKTVK